MAKSPRRSSKSGPKVRAHPVLPKLGILLFVAVVAIIGAQFVFRSSAASNPIAGATLYRDPQNADAANQATAWRASRPADAAQMDKIAAQPQAFWMGDWTPNSQQAASSYTQRATAAGALGVIVAYNIPGRDCGLYSAGGAASHANYRTWIDGLAAGIAQRKTVVILEPDALPQLDCLDAAGKTARLDSIKYAVSKLETTSAALVYIDIGNSGWLSAAEAAARLQQANVSLAQGFALNVSNFYTTTQNTTYGTDVSGRIGGKHFLIDTSRNGLGHNGEWCNPSGRGLGEAPKTATRSALVDAYLWIKTPGQSDGTCSGGPTAGVWWGEYALGLAQRAQLGTAAATPTPVKTPTPAPATKTPTPAPATETPTPKPQATPSLTPRPSPTPPPVIISGSTNGTTGGAPVVSGTITLQPSSALGGSSQITVNGRELPAGSQLDTRYLANGTHEVTVKTTAPNGKATTTTTNIVVNNNLTAWEKARNFLFAPFKGHKQSIDIGVVLLGAVLIGCTTLGGMKLWSLRPPDPNSP